MCGNQIVTKEHWTQMTHTEVVNALYIIYVDWIVCVRDISTRSISIAVNTLFSVHNHTVVDDFRPMCWLLQHMTSRTNGYDCQSFYWIFVTWYLPVCSHVVMYIRLLMVIFLTSTHSLVLAIWANFHCTAAVRPSMACGQLKQQLELFALLLEFGNNINLCPFAEHTLCVINAWALNEPPKIPSDVIRMTFLIEIFSIVCLFWLIDFI